jgi:hypothetical protein
MWRHFRSGGDLTWLRSHFGGRDGTPGEEWDIAPLGDFYLDRVKLADDEIVSLKRAAQSARFDPHHRIGVSVECFIALKDFEGDRVGLDLLGLPGKSCLDNIAQELAQALGHPELGARDDMVKLRVHLLRPRRMPSISIFGWRPPRVMHNGLPAASHS